MKVRILQTGSAGNCATIDDVIAIDNGTALTPDVDYLLITHEHSDHTKGLDKVLNVPKYCTQVVADRLAKRAPYLQFGIVERTFKLTGIDCDYYVTPIPLTHDVPCFGYEIAKCAINADNERILFCTDFNRFVEPERIVRALRNKEYDAVYIECNNTLSPTDIIECVTGDELPRDEFHRRKSFQNHCSAQYLIDLLREAGFSEDRPCDTPFTLLHKSKSYYATNPKKIVELCRVANILNPAYEDRLPKSLQDAKDAYINTY